MDILKGRKRACRFASVCSKRKAGNVCCDDNEKAANYYEPGVGAGCFRDMVHLYRHLCPGVVY